jgi:hypothetical protein
MDFNYFIIYHLNFINQIIILNYQIIPYIHIQTNLYYSCYVYNMNNLYNNNNLNFIIKIIQYTLIVFKLLKSKFVRSPNFIFCVSTLKGDFDP